MTERLNKRDKIIVKGRGKSYIWEYLRKYYLRW